LLFEAEVFSLGLLLSRIIFANWIPAREIGVSGLVVLVLPTLPQPVDSRSKVG
jgi:hypothetical protein